MLNIQQKGAPWEGAVRNLGIFYSPLIKASQRVYEGYFHTSDILPTLASAAGIKVDDVDGFDQWNVLVNGGKSPRKEIVTSLDPIVGYTGIISGKWKFVKGTTYFGVFDRFLGNLEEFEVSEDLHARTVLSSRAGRAIKATSDSRQPALTIAKIKGLRQKLKISCNEADNPAIRCKPLKSPCLFNIIADPCERTNLAENFPATVKKLQQRMIDLVRTSAPIRRTAISDLRCDPLNHDGTWGWWISNSSTIPEPKSAILQLLDLKIKILNTLKLFP